MGTVLEGLLGEGSLIYLDDIVVHGQTWQECLHQLLQVLEQFGEARLKVKLSKCQLFHHCVAFLGLVVSAHARRGGRYPAVWETPTASMGYAHMTRVF